MSKRISILELLDTVSGSTQEVARFSENIEAPFFRGKTDLLYNTGGSIYRIRPASGVDWEHLTVGDALVTGVLDTGFCRRCNNDHVLSPDGSMLAVSHHGEPDFQSRIYVVDLTGEKPPRLVTPDAPSYLHGWSPDGLTLAYCACRNGEYAMYIPFPQPAEKKPDLPMRRDWMTGLSMHRTDGISGSVPCAAAEWTAGGWMRTEGTRSGSPTTDGTTGSPMLHRTAGLWRISPMIPVKRLPTTIRQTDMWRSAVCVPMVRKTVL